MNVLNQLVKNDYAIYQGDNVELIKGVPDDSIHYTLFSPPFVAVYTFSDSERDMSNCSGPDEFMEHFRFLAQELFRVTMPGRLVSIHCMDIAKIKSTHGIIGVLDFPGLLIREMERCGFIYHSRVTIWKDPLVSAVRTRALGLMHKQIVKDSTMCRQGFADYIVTFRKPGENPEAVAHPDGFTEYVGTDEIKDGVFSHMVWRRYASPVWMDIKQTNTLNVSGSKEDSDGKHICPLQLDAIERCVHLWTNPGDIVFDPFAGIGSVPYSAVKLGRRGLGFELKEAYYNVMVKNMELACKSDGFVQQSFFKD